MMRTALIASLLALLLAACGSTDENMAFKSLPSEGWAYGDVLEFDDACTDSLVSTGKIVVAVRHTDAYVYSNLWLELEAEDAVGNLCTDTLNIVLADTYGNWQGRGIGVSYLASDTLDAIYRFDSQRPPRLRHIMRVDTLKDIEQIGLIFIKQQ